MYMPFIGKAYLRLSFASPVSSSEVFEFIPSAFFSKVCDAWTLLTRTAGSFLEQFVLE